MRGCTAGRSKAQIARFEQNAFFTGGLQNQSGSYTGYSSAHDGNIKLRIYAGRILCGKRINGFLPKAYRITISRYHCFPFCLI